MRPEQYRRRGSDLQQPVAEERAPLLGTSKAGPNGVEPNLKAELRSLCPLFLLIFVEVAALGLPIAILPIITTTEFAISLYDAPTDLSFVHFDGSCTIGIWSQATVQQLVGNIVPTASECPEVNDQGIPVPAGQSDEPCCAESVPPDGGDHLSYPPASCPTGLDGFSDVTANNFYYPNRASCSSGNSYAAAALAYSDAAKNVLTFFASAAIGAVADAQGRKTMLVAAEIVASLPNLALYLWWIWPVFSIYIYYVVRALSGLMSSVAVGIAYVADKTSEENRAACIGLLIAIAALGIVAAPIGAALPYTLAFLTSNVLNAFTVIWTAFMISESLPPERREPLVLKNVNPVRTMNVLVRSRIFICLTIAVLFNSASNKGTTDISPFVLQQSFGMNSQDIGNLVVGLGFVVICVMANIKNFIKLMSERGVIIFGIAAGIPFYIGMAVMSIDGRPWQAYALTLSFAALSTLVFPATSSMLSRNSGSDEQGLVQGALFGAQSLAQALGGVLFSSLYAGIASNSGVWAYGAAAVCQVVAMIAVLFLPRNCDGPGNELG